MQRYDTLLAFQREHPANYPVHNITANVISRIVEHPVLNTELDMGALRDALDFRLTNPHVALTIREAEIIMAYAEEMRGLDPSNPLASLTWWEERLRSALKFTYRNQLDLLLIRVTP